MSEFEEVQGPWMRFVEWATPMPITDLEGRTLFGTEPLATNNRQRIAWAIRNQRNTAGKTVMEVKEEAAYICEAAVSYLARNTLARHETAAVERANKDEFGPLLNLPVGGFIEYVQKELIAKGYTDRYPVLEEFTQPKWKRYWDSTNLFHEDVIRFLLRPEVQLASIRNSPDELLAYPYEGITRPDGSVVAAPDDFPTLVGVAAVKCTKAILSDPLRILGLMVQLSLAYQPAVVEASKLIATELDEIWTDAFISMRKVLDPGRWDELDLEQRDIITRTWQYLVFGITRLIDGYVVNNTLYRHTKSRNVHTGLQVPADIFIPAMLMAVGYDAVMDDPTIGQAPPPAQRKGPPRQLKRPLRVRLHNRSWR